MTFILAFAERVELCNIVNRTLFFMQAASDLCVPVMMTQLMFSILFNEFLVFIKWSHHHHLFLSYKYVGVDNLCNLCNNENKWNKNILY